MLNTLEQCCDKVRKQDKQASTKRRSFSSKISNKSCTVPEFINKSMCSSVPFAKEPIVTAASSLTAFVIFLSFNNCINRGTMPWVITLSFCRFEPITEFFIQMMEFKHFSGSDEYSASMYDRELSTSYKILNYDQVIYRLTRQY